jgi:uncharacterized protein YcbX
MTDTRPVLSALYCHPVKSMHGQRLDASPVSAAGLPFDRMWMVGDANGRFVTGREYPELVLIDAQASALGVTLSASGRAPLFVPNSAFDDPAPVTVWGDIFSAWRGAVEADEWISAYIGARLRLLWTGAETARRVKADPAGALVLCRRLSAADHRPGVP